MNWRKYWKPALAIVILISTVTVFVHYFIKNPQIRHRLAHIPLSLFISLLFLYFLTSVAIGLTNVATLRLCKIKAGPKVIWLLTAYTAVINFFGPLQSGPAVRAVYLKKKYNLNLKIYTIATFVYYFFYAAFSGLFLLSGLLKWWLVPLSIVGLLVLYGCSFHPKIKASLKLIDIKAWYYLAIATFIQMCLMVSIYYLEVHYVDPGVKLHQVIVYTGAANFALFVSITPGAIGFRESFLVFSKRLHHISDTVIVSANIIDRAVYIVYLLILAALIFLTHSKDFMSMRNARKKPAEKQLKAAS